MRYLYRLLYSTSLYSSSLFSLFFFYMWTWILFALKLRKTSGVMGNIYSGRFDFARTKHNIKAINDSSSFFHIIYVYSSKKKGSLSKAFWAPESSGHSFMISSIAGNASMKRKEESLGDRQMIWSDTSENFSLHFSGRDGWYLQHRSQYRIAG